MKYFFTTKVKVVLIVAVLLIAVLVPVWRQRRGGAGDEA